MRKTKKTAVNVHSQSHSTGPSLRAESSLRVHGRLARGSVPLGLSRALRDEHLLALLQDVVLAVLDALEVVSAGARDGHVDGVADPVVAGKERLLLDAELPDADGET